MQPKQKPRLKPRYSFYEIKKLEEKLQIYEQLIDMKADITHLKRGVLKK